MAKILLIEDMKGVRESLSLILDRSGHDVVQAENGEAGLKLCEGANFDLIITDILMPKVDGVEVIMQLKNQSQSKATPILAISGGGANVSAENALTIARNFADEVLAKPFSRDDILMVVDRLTQSNEPE